MIEKKKCLLSPQKKTNKHSRCNHILHVSANKRFAQNASAIWARLMRGKYDFPSQEERKAAMAFANAINLHFASRKKPLMLPVICGDLCSHHKIGRNDVYFPIGQWNEALPVMLKVLALIRKVDRHD
ncbi:hypothetical protein Mhun_1001 [Methanospirillum hungatei JF-1]|uniref:Uncharacterized protein n=1 Tax=Methanospirillum hungatei JF-1 (strain ATCC 27890 / DSM 864 / NBRC 100397 / JF-1) TaxID=323259 RepID=Q2FPK5_METHJ|nr:hypothetical protein [Methanospirillum hungatei]ABD40751.1 hypothetical protein Mhun_1001 [Methanospirillum hungatei JF-1]